MRTLFVAVALLLSGGLSAQTFSDLIEQAFKEYQEGQFASSAESYRQAFDHSEGSATDYYNDACSYALR